MGCSPVQLALHRVAEIPALLQNYRNRYSLLGSVGEAAFVRVGGSGFISRPIKSGE